MNPMKRAPVNFYSALSGLAGQGFFCNIQKKHAARMSCLLPLCFRPYPPLGPRRRQNRQENHSPAARKGGLENFFSREVFYFTSHLVFSASRLISLLPTLPPDAPAFYPRRAVAHQPLAMPDAHGLLMPEEAAARNMGNTKPAFGKKKVSIAIKKYQKCLFD